MAVRILKRFPLKLFSLTVLAISLVGFALTQLSIHAFAIQSKPQTETSYYVTSNDTGVAQSEGCSQAETDSSNNVGTSLVILDFGGQTSDGSGTDLPGTFSDFISNSDIEAVSEAYAYGY